MLDVDLADVVPTVEVNRVGKEDNGLKTKDKGKKTLHLRTPPLRNAIA